LQHARSTLRYHALCKQDEKSGFTEQAEAFCEWLWHFGASETSEFLNQNWSAGSRVRPRPSLRPAGINNSRSNHHKRQSYWSLRGGHGLAACTTTLRFHAPCNADTRHGTRPGKAFDGPLFDPCWPELSRAFVADKGLATLLKPANEGQCAVPSRKKAGWHTTG
jgi:hypothetical protein